MATCPQCGARTGPTQRRCRSCGCELGRARSSDGLFGRFVRWLRGLFGVRSGLPRLSFSVRMGPESVEATPGGLTDLDSLPPELREAVGRARPADGATGVSEKVTSAGPVTFTTRTVTRTYRSLDEIPPDLRQRVADAVAKGGSGVSSGITVDIDGERRTYSRIEDVPEPYRQAIEAARRKAGLA